MVIIVDAGVEIDMVEDGATVIVSVTVTISVSSVVIDIRLEL